MKKLIVLLCVGVMTFSLVACGGGSSDAPTPTASPAPTASPIPTASPVPTASPTPEESEIPTYDEAKQAILDHVDVAYSGRTALNAPMYFLASNDGLYAAIVLESADEKSYVKFIGSATIDENDIMTITDSEKGYTFGFTAEEQEDGSFFLDCGNLGECYLEWDEPENVVDYIILTLQEMEDVTDELIAEVTKQKDTITIMSEDGNFTAEIPSDWEEDNSLNEEADLQASNERSMSYFVLLAEDKDEFGYAFEIWKEVVLSFLTESLENAELSEEVKIEINGRSAIQQTLSGISDDTAVKYLLTYIDGEKYYGQILCGSVDVTYESSLSSFDAIINSINGL